MGFWFWWNVAFFALNTVCAVVNGATNHPLMAAINGTIAVGCAFFAGYLSTGEQR